MSPAKLPPPEPAGAVDRLLALLAATVRLYLETAVAHWNVEGPAFFELHRELGKQWERLVGDADRIAERVRALGESISIPPGADLSIPAERDAVRIASRLRELRLSAAESCRALHAAAEAAGDSATSMLAEELALEHEKRAWMFAAFLGS